MNRFLILRGYVLATDGKDAKFEAEMCGRFADDLPFSSTDTRFLNEAEQLVIWEGDIIYPNPHSSGSYVEPDDYTEPKAHGSIRLATVQDVVNFGVIAPEEVKPNVIEYNSPPEGMGITERGI